MVQFFTLVALSLIIVSSVPAARAADVGASTSIKHEQQWIVDTIGRDVTQMVLFAASKNGKAVDFDALNYETVESATTPDYVYKVTYVVGRQPESRTIKLKGYIWNPDNYAEIAAESLKQLTLSAKETNANPSDDTIQKLSDCTSESLSDLNKKLSSELTSSPLDPLLHEQAALLCSTMALKECARRFSDVRPWLGRITAHLAMARAIRQNAASSTAGKLAEIVLLSLGGRGAEALSSLDSITSDSNNATLKSWLRALRTRITHDFRIADLTNATLIEKLEFGRALAKDLNADDVTDYLQKTQKEGSAQRSGSAPSIDWIRIAISGRTSVESGHIYAESGVAAEMADLATDIKRYHPDQTYATTADLLKDLDLEPTGAILKDKDWKLIVISWPDLAAFHCRHLLDSVFEQFDFEENRLGVPETAKQTAELSESTFGTLRLFPLCRVDMACETWDDDHRQRKRADAKLTDAVTELVKSHPQLIDSELWRRACLSAIDRGKFPDPKQWFAPSMLFGTAFDYDSRISFINTLTLDDLEKFHDLDPYDITLLLHIAKVRYGTHATGDQMVRTIGDLANYDLQVMKTIGTAFKGEPDKQIPWLEKAARFDPSMYFELGAALQTRDPEKARAAYEKGIELGRDTVQKSNECWWLVKYYLDHGQNDKAEKLAQFAAGVYSAEGLGTLGYFYDRTGQLDQAEKTFKAQAERYDGLDALGLFYLRHADHSPQYQQLADEEYKKYFKHSISRITPQDMQAPPMSGIKIKEDSALSRSYGLKIGIIVVAVDGYRCGNSDEFYFLRDLHLEAKTVEMTFWDGQSYHTIKGSPPNRRFDFQFDDYPKVH